MFRISRSLSWWVFCIGFLAWVADCETASSKTEEPSVAATHQRKSDAARNPSRAAERQTLMVEGRSAQLIADYPKALEEYEEGLRRAQASGNRKAAANFHSRIGTVHRDLGDYDQAL